MDGAVATNAAIVDRPHIRQDLNLYEAGEDQDGGRIWRLHDPLANRFYQLNERDVELLALVGHRSANEIAENTGSLGDQEVSEGEVIELFDFLRRNNLVKGDSLQQGIYRHTLSFSRIKNWMESAVRNPLFFRIPLWNPDRFLDMTMPYVTWMGTKASMYGLVVIGLLGFYLVGQQVDRFLMTFLHFFNLSGIFVYLIALFGVKVLHELGHAYTAKSLGCRVPIIGVAFMVGWPILYTDTTDVWKIPDRKKRLRIGIAGVSVELAIAVLALFLWAITPEGAWKSAFFLLATTTWLLSIAVNFNPLMRFDGYYLLSDLADTPNLEDRAFTMAKWWLREKLFGFNAPPPEQPRGWFVVFAFGVWTYRFLLFLGIALLVYNFFFKAAGIALFVAEIIYFIAMPIVREVKEWWDRRDNIVLNDSLKRTLAVLAAASLLLLVPWQNDVTLPSVLKAKTNDLYLHVPGKLVTLTDAAHVEKDELLYRFESPELELRIEEAKNRQEELYWMRSSIGFDDRLRSERLIVESDLRTETQKLQTLLEQVDQLRVIAPFRGRVTDRSPELMPGDWLPTGTRLASIVDEDDIQVIAYLPENQLSRIETGMTARFYPENPEYGIRDVVVSEIEYMGTPEFDSLYLASTFGGDVAVRENNQGDMLTVESQYKVRLRLTDEHAAVNQVVRGTVIVDGNSVSLFSQIKRRFVAVFIRETGF